MTPGKAMNDAAARERRGFESQAEGYDPASVLPTCLRLR